MKILLPFVSMILIALQINAQVVETVISDPELRDGLHIDLLGNIYTTSGGFAGFEVGQYDIQTETFNPNFATGFFGPVDVDQYQDSLLIVTNYDNNTVSSFNLNTNEHNIIATGLDGPSGLVIDAQENIYVASWGNAPNYAGHQVHKISPSGQVSLYVDSPVLYRPQAMTTDLDGKLIIHSNEKLYRVNDIDSTLQLWIDVGAVIGHMAFRQKDSCIYATANYKILKINPSGEISTFAGTTVGYQDGQIGSAKFKSLLGIDFSPTEDSLYVCDSGYSESPGRLRRIVMNPLVETVELENNEINIFPNPVQHEMSIIQPVEIEATIEIYDILGNLLLSELRHARKITINTSKLLSGAYFIKVNYPEESILKKFIKQ